MVLFNDLSKVFFCHFASFKCTKASYLPRRELTAFLHTFSVGFVFMTMRLISICILLKCDLKLFYFNHISLYLFYIVHIRLNQTYRCGFEGHTMRSRAGIGIEVILPPAAHQDRLSNPSRGCDRQWL